jgi:hypothetical protein
MIPFGKAHNDQYMTPTANPKAGSTKVCGKSIRAPERGLTETNSARLLITAITMSPATANEMTHPPDPDIPISCPEVTNNPIPIVPLNDIAVAGSVNNQSNRGVDELTGQVMAFELSVESIIVEE